MDYRVMLVEMTNIMLERLSAVIKGMAGFELVARYTSPGDALGQGVLFKPNIILLDIDHEENVFAIPQFVRNYPGSTIVCLCHRWDAEMASRVVKIGAKGCLVKPFTGQELAGAIEIFNKSGMGVASNVLTFFSPKGKSGKTTLIANLAIHLAQVSQSTVGIIDADWQFGDMDLFFNLTPQATITEALRDVSVLSPVTLNSYFLPVNMNQRVMVMCGTSRPEDAERLDPQNFVDMVTMARSLFRFVLIDLAPAFNPLSVAAAEASDTTYMVAMENGAFEIDHMRRALEIFRAWPDCESRLKVLFTRVQPCDMEAKRRLEAAMEYPVEAIFPNEYELVSKAADEGRMAMELDPKSIMAQSIDALARRIVNRKMS